MEKIHTKCLFLNSGKNKKYSQKKYLNLDAHYENKPIQI